jgi:hypothetical protein
MTRTSTSSSEHDERRPPNRQGFAAMVTAEPASLASVGEAMAAHLADLESTHVEGA